MKIGPKYKICRRVGARVFGKCQTTKFSISGTAKGGAGRTSRPRAISEYGGQLLEKQKAKYTYGVNERQFANYVKKARTAILGNPVESLYKLLEARLDNIVFQLGLAPTRLAARQLVSHGHILVNGRRVTIPSHQLKIGDRVNVRPQSGERGPFRDLPEKLKNRTVPSWLTFEVAAKEGVVKGLPARQEAELIINFNSIIEFYSRV